MKNYSKISKIAGSALAGAGIILSPVGYALAEEGKDVNHMPGANQRDFCDEDALFYGVNPKSSLWQMTRAVIENNGLYEGMAINRATGMLLEAATQRTIEGLVAKQGTSSLNAQENSNLMHLMVDLAAYGKITDNEWVDRDTLYSHDEGNSADEIVGKDGWRGDLIYAGEGICISGEDLEGITDGTYSSDEVAEFFEEQILDRRDGEIEDIKESLTVVQATEAYEAMGLVVVPNESMLDVYGGALIGNEQPEGLGGALIEVNGVGSVTNNKGTNLVGTINAQTAFGPFWGIQGGLFDLELNPGMAVMTRNPDNTFKIGLGPMLNINATAINYDGNKFTSGSLAGGIQGRFELGNYTTPVHLDSTVFAALGIEGQDGDMDREAALALFGADVGVDVKVSDKARLEAGLRLRGHGRVDFEGSQKTDTSISDLRTSLGLTFQADNNQSIGPQVGVGFRDNGVSYFTVGVTGRTRK